MCGIVLHYTRTAPLTTIAADYKRARAQKKTTDEISKLARRNAKLEMHMDEASKRYEDQLSELKALIAKVEKVARPRQIVLNRKSNRYHKVLTHVVDVGSDAIAYCGWKYARVPVAFFSDLPEDAVKICSTCLGDKKAERRMKQKKV